MIPRHSLAAEEFKNSQLTKSYKASIKEHCSIEESDLLACMSDLSLPNEERKLTDSDRLFIYGSRRSSKLQKVSNDADELILEEKKS